MNIKKIIKSVPVAQPIINIITGREFSEDRKFFYRYSNVSKNKTRAQLEYELLTNLHKLEKGFVSENMRPFGGEKVKNVINTLDLNIIPQSSYTYKLAVSMLVSYKELYERQNWTKYEQYHLVNDYINNNSLKKSLSYGSLTIDINDLNELSIDSYESFIGKRHSIRCFSNKKVDDVKIKRAIEVALHSPSACNRQPCKVYRIKNKRNKRLLEKTLPGFNLFNLDNIGLLVITFDMSFALFAGERNQGWFNAGLFSMNLVNALHSEKIGTCFLQWGEKYDTEAKIKKRLEIPDSERIAVVVAFGYYNIKTKVPYSTRRPVDEVYRISE